MVAFLMVAVIYLFQMYSDVNQYYKYCLKSIDEYQHLSKSLKRENAMLKAEIVILRRADKDNRPAGSSDTELLPGWELRP